MNNIMIFDNPEFGSLRTILIDNEPWFVAKDVSERLGYAKTYSMTKLIDGEDKRNISSSILEDVNAKRAYTLGIINESGLYAAIFGSTLENAKKFKHWVTSEVLPQIRKAGSYAIPQMLSPLHPSIASGVADLGRVTERIMKNQGSAPHKIAEVFKIQCEQFGILLPTDFVKVPEYEQMALDVAAQ